MVKCVICCADIHIRNIQRHEEYKEQLQKFIDNCKETVSKYNKDECRICVLGDLLHQKIQISNELLILVSWFLKELDSICKTLIIAGNHDFIESNKDRVDSITPIFDMIDFENVLYLDRISEYKSSCIEDDNIIWVLYSIFDDYNRPDIDKIKKENPDKRFIGLFHGPIIGSSTDIGFTISKGINPQIFEGCDFVLCGDIHKKQELLVKSVPLYYVGSIIQQNYGENVQGHGFSIFDIENNTQEHIEIENDYGYYKFSISTVEDVDNDKEVLLNY